MKPEKIDLDEHYPCPRCKRGQLRAIILTEAFGCDRCNQIFGLTEESYTLEQLSTSYPYKKAWQWTGSVWRDDSQGLERGYVPLVTVIVILPLILLWLPASLSLSQTSSVIFWSLVLVSVLVIPAAMFWLSLRRP